MSKGNKSGKGHGLPPQGEDFPALGGKSGWGGKSSWGGAAFSSAASSSGYPSSAGPSAVQGPSTSSTSLPVMTPRAEEAVRSACDEHVREAGSGGSMTLEKVVPFTQKALVKMGFLSVEKVAVLTAEDWAASKLPQGLRPKVVAAATAAARAEAPPAGPPSVALPPAEGTLAELKTPKGAFGSLKVQGTSPIRLLANHFLMSLGRELRGANSGKWKMWQVDFPVGSGAESAGSGQAKGKGKGKGGNRVPRQPGKERRKAAIAKLLEGLDTATWLYDGCHRLYTLASSSLKPPLGERSVDAPGMFSGKVSITPAVDQNVPMQKQQELDLSLLARPEENCFEERRFLNVCMRSYAAEQLKLITQGRRVICQDSRILADEGSQNLKFGRELWFGYLAQVELIDGGAQGPRCSLNLNLVASVGLREQSAVDLLAKILAENYKGRLEDNIEYYNGQLRAGRWPPELDGKMLKTLDGETGFRKLRVCTEYWGNNEKRKASVVGVDTVPANKRTFWYEEGDVQEYITVADYFKRKRGITLRCPNLPCLELTKKGNYVPIELVKVMGGEHNILVGKLRPEYQKEVTKRTAMDPSKRRDGIQNALKDLELGPKQGLKEKGLDVEVSMLELQGHVLSAPMLRASQGASAQPNGWAGRVEAIAPPQFTVPWVLWSFTKDSEGDLKSFAQDFVNAGSSSGMWFEKAYVEWPEECWRRQWGSVEEVKAAMLKDLLELTQRLSPKLLVVLLPDDEAQARRLRGLLKMLTETEEQLAKSGLATQCVACKPKFGKNPMTGLQAAKEKLKMLMLKVAPKLPLREDGSGVAHYVELGSLHRVLCKRYTMVMGADVTHNVVGVSVAGVVASRGGDFATYFSEVRGQAPFAEEGYKERRRRSEERILGLNDMAEALLKNWRSANGRLPEVVFYYRDGVSDGQFVPVLKRERGALAEAFARVGGPSYDPELVIIVGQKRHQTRFWKKDEKGGKGRGKGGEGKGKGGGKNDPSQVPPGTVAGEGIAQPGHLNFFLVAHVGIQGTSVPCHYHVLHLDKRLVEAGVGVDDLERITYDLCHLYSRADKTVSYAAPAYLADHLCERGKLYLETQFAEEGEVSSLAPSGSLSSEEEAKLREAIEKRVGWLNALQTKSQALSCLGRNYFC